MQLLESIVRRCNPHSYEVEMSRSLIGVVLSAVFCLSAHAETIGAEVTKSIGNLSTHTEKRVIMDYDACGPQNPRTNSRVDASWQPGSGWAIIDVSKTENEADSGGGDIGLVTGGPNYPSATSISSQFALLTALAHATKNTAAAQEIQTTLSAWLKARAGLPAQNMTSFYVWAKSHGFCDELFGGSANYSFSAKIRFVGTADDLTDTINTLIIKYFPDK